MKNRVFLWDTIYNRLLIEGVEGYSIDIRYLKRWITKFPHCFPMFMQKENYTPIFNPYKYRWEILKGTHKIDFDPSLYL